MRAVNQIISYDLPFIMAALVPVMLAGSLRLGAIADAQQGLWFVFFPVIGQLAFLAFIVASVAATASLTMSVTSSSCSCESTSRASEGTRH